MCAQVPGYVNFTVKLFWYVYHQEYIGAIDDLTAVCVCVCVCVCVYMCACARVLRLEEI